MKNLQTTVIDIVAGILKIPSNEVSQDSRIDVTRNWDSLTNMDILLEIENHFSISFSASELQELDRVSSICSNLERRLA